MYSIQRTDQYASLPGTNFGGGTLDAVKYSVGGLSLYLRALKLGNLKNPTNLPPVNGSVAYTNQSTTITFETSVDGTNYFAATGSGSLLISLSNTNPAVGTATLYHMEGRALNVAGSSGFGPYHLRLTPNSSPGTHIVQPNPIGPGYLIASSINLSTEYSSDGITYYPADKPLHLQLANAPCGFAGEQARVKLSGTSSVIISWLNANYKLQGSPNLVPGAWTNIAGTSPITLSLSGTNHYFRLVCQ